jgi:hypothetical protein
MPRKKKLSNQEYKERLKTLREFNKFSFDARNKLTPARKSAITRAYNRNKVVYDALKNQEERSVGPKFKFLKGGTRKKQRQLKGVTDFITSKGAFISVKHADKGKPQKLTDWKFNSKGDLEFRVRNRRQIFVPFDAKNFVGKTKAQQRAILEGLLSKYGLQDPAKSPLWFVSFNLRSNEIETPREVDVFISQWVDLYAKGASEGNLPVTGFNFYTYDLLD